MSTGASLWRTVACASLACAALMAPRRAGAQEISAEENVRMMHGETITREQTLERGEDRRFVGGVTYTVIEASSEELDSLLEDPAAYKQILPRTKRARIVGVEDSDFFVELHQGNAIVEAEYTIRVHRDPAKREVRFWLDPTRPHGIDDAWGFFRYEPLAQVSPGVPRLLLTFGVLVDLGPGLIRDLFEEKVRAMMLSVPQRLRQYVWKVIRPRRPRVRA